MNKTITKERVESILRYDEDTGLFIYRVAVDSGKHKAGSIAGYCDNGGYRVIGIDKRYYKAHRLAWLVTYGEMPDGNIDHINGDKADNRIHNLRPCNQSQNGMNSGIFSHNTSGIRGVNYRSDRAHKNWVAQISKNKRKIHLGYFYTKEDALAARRAAEISLFGEFSRHICP